MRIVIWSAASACVLLAGCGGGGGSPGGGVTTPPPPTPTIPTPTPTPVPTPTPTPPPVPNVSLENLTSSESFTNDAATGSIVYPADFTQGPTRIAAQTTTTVAYDLATQGYTVTTSGRSQTFLPSHIDASQSSAGATVYVRTTGTTTDSLLLTRPGNSGTLNFRYVAGGFWRRTDLAVASDRLDAFAYGLETPDAATPRAGKAEYAVTLLATHSSVPNTNEPVTAITGQGATQIDFASGAVITHGVVTTPFSREFSSEARLSSTTNSFTGNFRFGLAGAPESFNMNGRLDGRLFGPAAEEIGAAFSASRPNGDIMVGTLIGRGGPVTAGNTSFAALTVNEFFANDAARIRATLTGENGLNVTTGEFSGRSQAPLPLVVNYDVTNNSYTLMSPDGVHARNTDINFANATDPRTFMNFLDPQNLQYVRAAQWHQQAKIGGSTSYDISQFTFGMATPNAATPRTGRAGYNITVKAIAADSDYVNMMGFLGDGLLTADFATGGISAQAYGYYFEHFTSGRHFPNGQFSLNGSISSASNSFGGSVTLSGIGAYSGALNGRFYGPAAQELGAAFSASDGAGGVMTGFMVGYENPAILDPGTPLLSLTQPTTFAAISVNNGSPQSTGPDAYVAYNPSTNTYDFFPNSGAAGATLAYRAGPAQRDAAKSDSTATVYNTTGPAGQYNAGFQVEATVFNPGPANPRLELTYSSFASLKVVDGVRVSRLFFTYGLRTPQIQMPRSGSASYSGIVTGYGDLTTAHTPVTLSGDGTLAANFSASTFTAQVNAVATTASGTTTALPTATFSGPISGASFTSNTSPMNGNFYGPNAAEFGATFTGGQNLPNGSRNEWQGVLTGKKVP